MHQDPCISSLKISRIRILVVNIQIFIELYNYSCLEMNYYHTMFFRGDFGCFTVFYRQIFIDMRSPSTTVRSV
uniref:Uncharacterized protein n=1 Tax=Engystomops pustulosus TaxID=76066 RepID=A0AAV6YSR8_ENGPU|nr:hypothetical protein GDO81_019447 [Engystomops pustulosus]